MNKLLLATTLTGLLAATVACSSGAEESVTIDDSAAYQQLRARADSGRERPYDSLVNLIGLVEERHDDPAFTTVGGPQLVVTGSIVDVIQGASFNWTITDDGEEREQLSFGADDATVDTVHLTVEVDDVLAPHPEDEPGTITVGLAFDGGIDFTQTRNDMIALGDVVLFLNQTAVFDYESQLWSVVEDGGLIGNLLPTGDVEFPFLPVTSPLFEGDTINLDLLDIL